MAKILPSSSRISLAVLGAVLPFLGTVPLDAAQLEPKAIVSHFDDALLTVMGQAKKLGYQGRYSTLAPLIGETFDIPTMTRIAIGPSWSGLPEDQRNRLIAAFGHFIVATYAERFDGYGGEKFEVQGATPMAGGMLVENQLVKPDGTRVRINYLTHLTNDGWQAIDVYLDGTISELAVRRSEFTSILRQSGSEGLIAALEQKTQQLAAAQQNSA
jgi:phospholipid transport system substrate-binding protein